MPTSRETLTYILKDPLSAFLLIVLFIAIISVTLAAYVSPYDPDHLNLDAKLQSPSSTYLMGTDEFGRDIVSRVIWGGRVSLFVAFSAIALAAILGVFLGMVSAYSGSLVDDAIMRVMDILLSFPVVVLAIALMASLGPGLTNVIIVISVVEVPVFARVTRGTILSEMQKEYVLAEKASGCPGYRLLVRHLLPNSIAPIIVQVSLAMADAILYEAALGFLGVGIRPPTSSWGSMLSKGRAFVLSGEWWLTVFPGIAITTSCLCFNFLGDRLRDALDPSLRRAIIEP